MRARSLSIVLLALSGACGEVQPSGIDSRFFVEDAAFRSGALPGAPPNAIEGAGPRVTSVEFASNIFRAGESGREIDGHVSPDGNSIAVQLVGEPGYWVEPVLGPDPTFSNDLGFSLEVGFGDLEPGAHTLRFVSVDPNGIAGTQREVGICIGRPFNDNLNACIPTNLPPATVVSLRIGNEADVDLVLVGPDEEVVDGDHPLGDGPGTVAPADLAEPSFPRLDRDANANCLSDGSLRETVVFRENPTAESWKVFANLTDACGTAASTFEIELYHRVDHGGGTYSLELTETFDGQFIAAQANGGAGSPLYVTTLDFP